MKFACQCGAVIRDSSDFLPYKAHLIPDQDYEDFLFPTSAWTHDHSYERACYQCTDCARLFLEDAQGHLQSFKPEGEPVQVLGSCKGADWRGNLRGHWQSNAAPPVKAGSLWCSAEGGSYDEFDDWLALEAAYFALFNRLQAKGRLRSASLLKDGKDSHVWEPGSTAVATPAGPAMPMSVTRKVQIAVLVVIAMGMLWGSVHFR